MRCSLITCVAVDQDSCPAALDVKFAYEPEAARAPPNCSADRFPRTWLLMTPDELATDHYPLRLPGASAIRSKRSWSLEFAL